MIEFGLLSLFAVGLLVGVARASYVVYHTSGSLEDEGPPHQKYDYLEYIEHGSFNIMD